ncbi:MAG: transposase, partial [Akkermansia sp.]
RKRKPKRKEIRKAIKQQLAYIKRNIGHINTMIAKGGVLTPKEQQEFQTVKSIYEQQREMYVKRTHRVDNRIISFHQPWLRPIVRGKAGKKIEIGAKLDASVDENNFTRLEYVSFDAYNESTKLQEVIDAYFQRTGHYPERILADQIYSTRENRKYCKERDIHLSGKPLGRPKKDMELQQADKKRNYQEQTERVEVERAFSQLKRKCGLGLITKRLKETTLHCIALSIFVQNLKKVFCALIEWWQNNQKTAQSRRIQSSELLYQLWCYIAAIWISEKRAVIQ